MILAAAALAGPGTVVGTEPWLGPVPEDQVRALVPPGWTAVALGQVFRGDRAVVVLWPGFRGRDLVDDDVVGFSFTRSGDAWTAGEGNVLLSGGDGRGKLAALLGGADDWTVRRACGADLPALAGELQARARAYVAAVDGRSPKAAARAFAGYSALLHEDAVLLSDAAIETARAFAATPLRCGSSTRPRSRRCRCSPAATGSWWCRRGHFPPSTLRASIGIPRGAGPHGAHDPPGASMWFLLAACSQAPELPSVPLEAAVAGVSDQLRSTAELTDRAEALRSLAAARQSFESSVEPHLRAERDPLDVAAAEYGFARVHRAIEGGGDARTEVEILIRRLHPPRLAQR